MALKCASLPGLGVGVQSKAICLSDQSVAEPWMSGFWGLLRGISAGWPICACPLIYHINARLDQQPCGLGALPGGVWKSTEKHMGNKQVRTHGGHFALPWFLFGWKCLPRMLKWKKCRWPDLSLPLLCARNTTLGPQNHRTGFYFSLQVRGNKC